MLVAWPIWLTGCERENLLAGKNAQDIVASAGYALLRAAHLAPILRRRARHADMQALR